MYMVMQTTKTGELLEIEEFESENEAWAWVEQVKGDHPDTCFDVYDEDDNDMFDEE